MDGYTLPERPVLLMLARSNAMHRLHLRAAVECGNMRDYRDMGFRPESFGTMRNGRTVWYYSPRLLDR